jgi:hypothetical protein
MWIAKLKAVVAAVLVVAALGVGVAYRSEAVWAEQVAQASPGKPRSELESLRRENELLKLNLEVVLEKVRAQEKELRALRAKAVAPQAGLGVERGNRYQAPATKSPDVERGNRYQAPPMKSPDVERGNRYQAPATKPPDVEWGNRYQAPATKPPDIERGNKYEELESKERPDAGGARQAEEALRALRAAKDDESRRRALEALDRALRSPRQ